MPEPYPARVIAAESPNGATAVHGIHITSLTAPTPSPNGQPEAEPKPASYNVAILALFGVALVGMAAAIYGAYQLYSPVLLAAAVTLGVSAGILAGVTVAQRRRTRPPRNTQSEQQSERETEPVRVEAAPEAVGDGEPVAQTEVDPFEARWPIVTRVKARLRALEAWLAARLKRLRLLPSLTFGTGAAGLLAMVLVLRHEPFEVWLDRWPAAIGAAACLVAAALAATAVRYLANIDPAMLPEAPGLARGARMTAWILIFAALSVGAVWAGYSVVVRSLDWMVLLINAGICIGLVRAGWRGRDGLKVFPADLGVARVLGSRNNIAASIVDSAEQQLGIDLRSTWALTIVRTSVEPLVICLFLAGWLSTSFTVVGLEEQGLNERFGVPAGQPLEPGVHLHLPWPIDRVLRVPVKRIQDLNVGHEGQEQEGPENVLWSVEHAPNEYTLVLGNGRDLITVDAGIAYRIVDSRAWHYHMQNPADTIKALAYRAVMRNTVNRTLEDALSQNVALLGTTMRNMVQQDADALGLGIRVESFTFGGMHPPVPVAQAYEAVISAEIGKVTAVVNAQVFRNRTVPGADSQALRNLNYARAEGAQALATAAGQAWSFRALESQFHAAPEEYRFRRRLETLEQGLFGKDYTVVDSRFQRDGGELWLTQ